MVDVTVHLLFISVFLGIILFSSRVIIPVSVVAYCLLPYPVRITFLNLSQLFTISFSAVCRQHDVHTQSQTNSGCIILMAMDCHVDRNLDLQTIFLRKQMNIKLPAVTIVIS